MLLSISQPPYQNEHFWVLSWVLLLNELLMEPEVEIAPEKQVNERSAGVTYTVYKQTSDIKSIFFLTFLFDFFIFFHILSSPILINKKTVNSYNDLIIPLIYDDIFFYF